MDLRSLGPSVVRTVTPWVVGVLVTLVGRAGFEWHPSVEAVTAVTGLVAAGYYALVRVLEERVSPSWGWLLGVKGAPVYLATEPLPLIVGERGPELLQPPPLPKLPSPARQPATGKPRGLVAWAVLLTVAGILEVYGIAHPGADDTLSEFTRNAFGVDQSVGRWVFGLGWAAFAAWFLVHILDVPKRKG